MVRLTYLEALRPYMDYSTGIVGIKRGVSYQSLREELYVEPQRGDAGGSPSRQQMRRAVKTLERAKLISIQSVGKKLILRCELATWDFSNQKLPDTKPTHQPASNSTYQNNHFSLSYKNVTHEADREQSTLPDIPPETGLNIICFSE